MQTFNSDGVRIAFMDQGEGQPILLIHGFASSVKEIGRASCRERVLDHV